jgi:hypothetical protein
VTDPHVLRNLGHVLHDAVPDGEVLVHYDIVVKTRSGPDMELINTYVISMPGADPDLTMGTLLRASGFLPANSRLPGVG